jgi:hypothetical protein
VDFGVQAVNFIYGESTSNEDPCRRVHSTFFGFRTRIPPKGVINKGNLSTLQLFPRDQVVGIFRGFQQGGLEFHADFALPYRSDFQNLPMHGQFVMSRLCKGASDEVRYDSKGCSNRRSKDCVIRDLMKNEKSRNYSEKDNRMLE